MVLEVGQAPVAEQPARIWRPGPTDLADSCLHVHPASRPVRSEVSLPAAAPGIRTARCLRGGPEHDRSRARAGRREWAVKREPFFEGGRISCVIRLMEGHIVRISRASEGFL
ncbi:hypothetical protein LIP_2703 [Limnochorda pilosa]|uniref:Uncharacterized protein n=1 Tax=Limnochorda pilosa TaxID=1555112 RepID=A0A0K2SN24_LIMPI|nr:hypothetical protein LIP_2703 [Limnochorda pilosa]